MCRARMGSLTFPKQISLKFRTYRKMILGSFLHMIFNSIYFFDNYNSLIGDTSFLKGVSTLSINECRSFR